MYYLYKDTFFFKKNYLIIFFSKILNFRKKNECLHNIDCQILKNEFFDTTNDFNLLTKNSSFTAKSFEQILNDFYHKKKLEQIDNKKIKLRSI